MAYKKDRRTGVVLNEVGEEYYTYQQRKRLVKANLKTKNELNMTKQELSSLKDEMKELKELVSKVINVGNNITS